MVISAWRACCESFLRLCICIVPALLAWLFSNTPLRRALNSNQVRSGLKCLSNSDLSSLCGREQRPGSAGFFRVTQSEKPVERESIQCQANSRELGTARATEGSHLSLS